MKLIWEPQGSFPLKVSNYSSFHFIPSVSILMPTTYAASPLPSSSLLHLNLLYFSSCFLSRFIHVVLFRLFHHLSPYFSLYFRIFLYFYFLFLIALLCLSHFTLPTGQSLIFSNRVYANSQDDNRVSAGLSRGHALLTHTYIDSYTLRTLHTHTPRCCTCQDSQQYQLRLTLNTKDFWEVFTLLCYFKNKSLLAYISSF